MMDEGNAGVFEFEREYESAAQNLPVHEPILVELTKVLAAHPRGLRRWSVMRAIRKDRESASREIPHKLEDDVERIFRRFCADQGCAAKDAFFYRPKETAGEVWVVFPERAKALLAAAQ